MSDTQLSLLDLPSDPTYRTTDPETSRVAGLTVDVNAREAEVLEAMRYAAVAADTHDLRQVLLAYGLDRDNNCVARRLTSLERKGLVRRVGVKSGKFGRPTTLWRLVG